MATAAKKPAKKKRAAPKKKAKSGKVKDVRTLATPGCGVCGNAIAAIVLFDRDAPADIQPRCADHIPKG